MPVGEVAVLDDHVLAGHTDPAAVGVPAGLDGHTVVAGVVGDAVDDHAVAGLGSQPSVLGPDEEMVRPLMVTLRHRFGFRCQNGELITVTPSSSTVSLANGWIICGGR